MYTFTFQYDHKGSGELVLLINGNILSAIRARTGSRNGHGKLVNNIKSGIWRIKDAPVDTTEDAMYIKRNNGWKVRLFDHESHWTHYLIHPDGGAQKNNGTKGCIGLQDNDHRELKDKIERILKDQDEILVYVNTPMPHRSDT